MTPAIATELRVDSLGVTVLLFAVGLIAANPRFRTARDVGRLAPMRVDLDVVDRNGERAVEARSILSKLSVDDRTQAATTRGSRPRTKSST